MAVGDDASAVANGGESAERSEERKKHERTDKRASGCCCSIDGDGWKGRGR